MMICLTGDVHHFLGNPEQYYIEESEIELARKYLEIAKNYKIKVTLYITGESFKENVEEIDQLLKFSTVEIGGHTWNALRPIWIHKMFKLLGKSYYGPSLYQERDIKSTIQIIKKYTGEIPSSWRTHSYKSDNTTYKLLREEGIKIISDVVNNKLYDPYKLSKGLISLPINVMPDHSHIYHGSRTKKIVKELIKKRGNDSFTYNSYYINDYFEVLKSQIQFIEKKNGIATLLLHPSCMKVADNFESFRKFCQWINTKGYKTIKCKEVLNYLE